MLILRLLCELKKLETSSLPYKPNQQEIRPRNELRGILKAKNIDLIMFCVACCFQLNKGDETISPLGKETLTLEACLQTEKKHNPTMEVWPHVLLT